MHEIWRSSISMQTKVRCIYTERAIPDDDDDGYDDGDDDDDDE